MGWKRDSHHVTHCETSDRGSPQPAGITSDRQDRTFSCYLERHKKTRRRGDPNRSELTHFLGQQVDIGLVSAGWGVEQFNQRQRLQHERQKTYIFRHTARRAVNAANTGDSQYQSQRDEDSRRYNTVAFKVR